MAGFSWSKIQGVVAFIAMAHLFACEPRAAPPVTQGRAPARALPPALDRGTPDAAPPVASSSASTSCAPLSPKLPDLIATDIDAPVPPIEDFGDHQLAPMWNKLARIARQREKEPLRIAVYGDSNMTRDFITGEARRTLQAAFGDAGHGFVAVGKPWSWYLHENVKHGLADGWVSYNMTTQQVSDRLYGLGGIAAQSQMPRARAFFETADQDSPVGKTADHIEVMYLKTPTSGTFEVVVDGKKLANVDARATQISAGIERFDLPDAHHKLELYSGPEAMKPVRFLGVVLERRTPGVVIDCLGIGGVNMQLLTRGKRELMLQTLAMRKYDLVVLLTGATEPDLPSHVRSAKKLIATISKGAAGRCRDDALAPGSRWRDHRTPDEKHSHQSNRATKAGGLPRRKARVLGFSCGDGR